MSAPNASRQAPRALVSSQVAGRESELSHALDERSSVLGSDLIALNTAGKRVPRMDRERGRNGRFFGIIRRQDRHRDYSLKQRRDLSDAYAGISSKDGRHARTGRFDAR